jgi:ABC-type transport system involved in multi-copper enzyme maturation permease subunit
VEDFQEIVEIWRGELARALRSGRAIALVLVFVMAEALLLTVVGLLTSSGGQAAGVGASPEALNQKKSLLMLFTNNSEATVDSLAHLPGLLLIAFSATTLFAPLLIALMGFDQISGEVAPKSMRYLIVRARRNSIILGKYLTQATMLTAILTLCVITIVGAAKYLNADFTWPDALKWGVKLTVAISVIGVSYAALTTLCSCIANNGALSLFLNFITLFVFWFISLLGNRVRLPGSGDAVGFDAMKDESVLAYVRYLVPSQFEHHLLSPEPLEYATGVIAYIGFGLLFLGLSKLVLAKRDL